MHFNFVVDRVDRYGIDVRVANGHYTLHAVTHPPNTRGGTVNDHHLCSDGKICVVAGQEPRTIDRAKAIAMSWCDGWSKYQRGKPFPNGSKAVSVNS
jgi:hypothetical protein